MRGRRRKGRGRRRRKGGRESIVGFLVVGYGLFRLGLCAMVAV